MKTCPKCNSECEDNFELCWNCQYSFTEERILLNTEFSKACPHCNTEVDSSYKFCPNCQHKTGLNCLPAESSAYEGELKIECLRCQVPMFFKGSSRFPEGPGISAMGNPTELMTNREPFDLYFCPKCGKIEFFLPNNERIE